MCRCGASAAGADGADATWAATRGVGAGAVDAGGFGAGVWAPSENPGRSGGFGAGIFTSVLDASPFTGSTFTSAPTGSGRVASAAGDSARAGGGVVKGAVGFTAITGVGSGAEPCAGLATGLAVSTGFAAGFGIGAVRAAGFTAAVLDFDFGAAGGLLAATVAGLALGLTSFGLAFAGCPSADFAVLGLAACGGVGLDLPPPVFPAIGVVLRVARLATADAGDAFMLDTSCPSR